jgi:branched-chain amino acid transport system substrate-binding protein
MRRRLRARFLPLTAAGALTALVVAACGTGSATTNSSGTNPITIGISLPLTGSFSADGRATLRGYQLWASDINSNGGLLNGRPVQLKIMDDKSDPVKTGKDYTQLINQDRVNFTLAPFSSLLTVPAGQVTAKYHYALPAGSAGAPSVFAIHDPYMLSTNTPVQQQMVPFANWVLSLPFAQRPTTAAYPMVSDPFADPPVQRAHDILRQHGISTVYYSNNPVTPNATYSNLVPIADAVAAKNPQVVVLGTVDLPSLLAFIHEFEARHFTPKIMIASSGPDQGQAFLNQVGKLNAEGIMVPDAWYGGMQNALNHVMVQNYIAKYGGTVSDINADVAEAYSAGEVLAAGVTGTGNLDNTAINSYLHSHTVQTVVGPARFDANGQNTVTQISIFQWRSGQFVQVLQNGANGAVQATNIEPTKPAWQGS